MEDHDRTPAKGQTGSPTPSMSPTSPEGPAAGAVVRSFRKLGPETLRAVETPVYPKSTRVILETLEGDDYLPGQPRISLSAGPPSDEPEQGSELLKYLRDCHLTKSLDELMPVMKYIFVQTPDHKHIYPLHHQAAHARKIIVNENPGLHLIWYYDRIFVKPIPLYFLSAEFWSYLPNAEPDVYNAALGFMRSYYHLIRYELDYDLACELKLIPGRYDCGPEYRRRQDGGPEYPTYAEFCRFIEQFAKIENSAVCRRYHYGELRLTRINHATVLRKGKLAYFHIFLQWGSYFQHFFAPIILVLGGASVIMNAMQVNLNAQEMLKSEGAWKSFVRAALYFPAITIIMIAAVIGIFLLGSLGMSVHDLFRARGVRKKRRMGVTDYGGRSHGLI